MNLTFEQLRDISLNRCEDSFHLIQSWSPTDWGCAMGGECGEALNLIKKLRRATGPTYAETVDKIQNQTNAELIAAIGDEIADMVIYADLLATRLGLSLGDCVEKKFNETSDKVGSKYKL